MAQQKGAEEQMVGLVKPAVTSVDDDVISTDASTSRELSDWESLSEMSRQSLTMMCPLAEVEEDLAECREVEVKEPACAAPAVSGGEPGKWPPPTGIDGVDVPSEEKLTDGRDCEDVIIIKPNGNVHDSGAHEDPVPCTPAAGRREKRFSVTFEKQLSPEPGSGSDNDPGSPVVESRALLRDDPSSDCSPEEYSATPSPLPVAWRPGGPTVAAAAAAAATRVAHKDPFLNLRSDETVTSACSGTGEYVRELMRQGKLQRLVRKDGQCNISMTGVTNRRWRYLRDIFTTLIDMQWRYIVFFFGMGFLLTWLLFGLLYWFDCLIHGDHLHKDDEEYIKCMSNVYDFTTAFLFSLETQHTIGYGFRAMEPKCPEAIVLLMLQSAYGVFVQSMMTGIIFAKLARGKTRAKTILFSRNAVICKRDDVYCLLFRVGDMRPKSHIICANVRAILMRSHITQEGEKLPLCQYPLAIETEASLTDSYTFLVWPATIVHKITSESPLWDISAHQLHEEPFEIVVILEGAVGSSGASTQIRTSYMPTEILWGHHLAPLVTFQKQNGSYKIDYSQFHGTLPVEFPDLSPRDFAEQEEAARRRKQTTSESDDEVDFVLDRYRLGSGGGGIPPGFSIKIAQASGGTGTRRDFSLGSLRERLSRSRRRSSQADIPAPPMSPTFNGGFPWVIPKPGRLSRRKIVMDGMHGLKPVQPSLEKSSVTGVIGLNPAPNLLCCDDTEAHPGPPNVVPGGRQTRLTQASFSQDTPRQDDAASQPDIVEVLREIKFINTTLNDKINAI